MATFNRIQNFFFEIGAWDFHEFDSIIINIPNTPKALYICVGTYVDKSNSWRKQKYSFYFELSIDWQNEFENLGGFRYLSCNMQFTFKSCF